MGEGGVHTLEKSERNVKERLRHLCVTGSTVTVLAFAPAEGVG